MTPLKKKARSLLAKYADEEARKGELLKSGEIAEMLRITPRMVQLYAQNGDLPALRLRRELRFKRADVEAWLNRREELAA